MDDIFIANECVEEARRRKMEGLVCKIDLEKSYDKSGLGFP